MKSNLEEIPELDGADPKLSKRIALILERVQRQGDPLLIMRLDAIIRLGSEQEIVAAIQEATKDINWKE